MALPTDLTVDSLALAEALSIAIRIEPQLLRKMRLDLFPTADAGSEADLWFSSIVETRSPLGIVFQKPHADELRQRLQTKPRLLEEAWRVIEFVHRNISPPLFAEERLTYLALAGKKDEMQDLLRSTVASLLAPDRSGIASWAARAFSRFPNELKQSEEAQMLGVGAQLRLGDTSAHTALFGSAAMPNWISWLAPVGLPTITFNVALVENGVEFGPLPGRSLSHHIEIPQTDPIMVELSWTNDNIGPQVRRVALDPKRHTVVDTGPASEIDIRTVTGEAYTLGLPAPKRESLQQKLNRFRPPRVNITYEVETAGAVEQRALPFVIGVLGNFAGLGSSPPPIRDRKFVEITVDNFSAVQAASRISNPVEPGIEAAWLGLQYLVNNTETSSMLKIKMLHVTKEEIEEDVSNDLRRKIYDDEFGVLGGEPFGLLIGAHEFGYSEQDTNTLQRLSSIAAEAFAPFVAGASPAMFGLSSFSDFDKPINIEEWFERVELAQWREFRSREECRYVGLTVPHILLRGSLPQCWGNAAFAFAARVANAFATYGWCAAIRGIESGGLVEGLPTASYMDNNTGQILQRCTDIPFTYSSETELSRAGFLPLQQSTRADGAAAFLNANSLCLEPSLSVSNAAFTQPTDLRYTFAVSRFVHYLKFMMSDKIGSFMAGVDSERFLNRWLESYVASEPDARRPLAEARVEVLEGGSRAILSVRPGFQLEEPLTPIRVEFDLPTHSDVPNYRAPESLAE